MNVVQPHWPTLEVMEKRVGFAQLRIKFRYYDSDSDSDISFPSDETTGHYLDLDRVVLDYRAATKTGRALSGL